MSYDSLVAALSPWGYWKTDETSGTSEADSSGNSRTLTVFGSPTLALAGPDGGADAVGWPTTTGACAATQSSFTNAGAFTHVIWFYLTANPAANLAIQARAVDYGNSGAADGEFYISSDGKPHFHVFDTAHHTIDGTSAVSLNTWHMAAVSVGAAGMKLRIDKVTVASNGSVVTGYTGASQKIIVRGGGVGFTDTSVVRTAKPSYFTSQISDANTDALYDAMGYATQVLADSPVLWHRLDSLVAVSAATSSSNYPADTPENAFDGDSGTPWTTNATSTGWLSAQLSAAATLTGYSITSRSGFATRAPNTWTFEGSNNGSSWTTLDTRSGITWTGGDTKPYTFTNTTAYLYYRLNVTANNGDTYLGLNELALGLTGAADSSGNARPLMVVSGVAPTITSGGPSLSTAAEWGSSAGNLRTTYSQGQPTVGTYEMWVKFAANPAADVVLQTFDPGAGSTGGTATVFLLSTGKIRLQLYNGSTVNLDTPSAISTGAWHHVVCSWGAAGSKIRVDKSTLATGATTSATNAATAFYRVHGIYNGASLTSQTGALKLGDGAFYSTQLTDARTDAHYDAASGSANATVTAVAATATATAVAPSVAASSSVVPPAATATASAAAPTVAGTGSATVSAVAATATAAAVAPTVTADATVSSVAATSTATAVAPTVSATADATVLAVPATATAAAGIPMVNNGSGSATVFAVRATATATAPVPVFTQIIPVGTDTSNFMNGRNRSARASVTVTSPVGATPSNQATKYDKAVPYPPPTLVDGRVT